MVRPKSDSDSGRSRAQLLHNAMKRSGVYILQSLKNNRYYTGSTYDIENRLLQHNKGWVQATRNIGPLVLKVFIPCESLTEAKKSEYKLKKYKRRDILEKVIKDQTFPWDFKH